MTFNSGLKVLFALSIFSFASCSLKYEQPVSADEKNPEFIFSGANYTRYEKSQPVANLQAEKMERYRQSDAVYAQNVQFETYDKNQSVDNDGSCGLMYADTSRQLYEFYNGIRLFSNSFGASFSADNLRWDGKNQQLTSGRTDYVLIEKDNTTLYGSGFSASGVSGKFVFKNSAEGKIESESVEQAQNQAIQNRTESENKESE